MKHTPGPWTLNENETAPCELVGNGSIHIADIYCTDFPSGKADSLLIAAAPDLLRACKLALENLQARAETRQKWTVKDQSTFEVLQATIAKAGQS